MIAQILSKAIPSLLLCAFMLLGCGHCQEIKLIRTVNDLPITNLDLQEQEKITNFVINFLKIDSAKEKLTCDLRKTSLSNFVLSGLSEDIMLDDYLGKVAQKLSGCRVTKEETLSIISDIAENRKISPKSFETRLKKDKVDPNQLIDFFGKQIIRGKILRKVFEDECLSIQEDDIFRMALTNGCLTDVKLEYLSFSAPYSDKGFKSLVKTRAKLQKGVQETKEIKKNFLTELSDEEIAENLLNIDENSTSKIWKSGDHWKMVYLYKRKMINPDLTPLNSHFQALASIKMQGKVQQLFSQIESRSFIKDLK
jgi:hypothetical protein